MPDYNAIIGEFSREIDRLITLRDQITQRIEALITAMESTKVAAQEQVIEPIIPPPPLADEEGFTNRIRSLLKVNPARSFTPVEIRDILAEFDPKADQRILLIHVHNTVKRLHRQDEIEEISRPDGRAYGWKGLTPGEAKRMMEAHLPSNHPAMLLKQRKNKF